MKIILVAVSIILIFTISTCNARSREKRTLNSFLKYFGFKIVPLEDVEFVTEKIIESTRNPKAIRIQTLAPKLQDDKNITTTTPPTTTMISESNDEILPQDLIDASALNLDALIDALTIMKAPNVSHTKKINESNFIINVPSEEQKSGKLVEGSDDEMEFMQPPKINDSEKMQMMQPPVYNNSIEPMSEVADSQLPAPQMPLFYSQSTLPLTLPSELTSPFFNAFEIVRSKEISIPSNEIIVGNSITVADNPFQQQNLLPQPRIPSFQPIPMVFANGLF